MFGKRGGAPGSKVARSSLAPELQNETPPGEDRPSTDSPVRGSENFSDIRSSVLAALIDAIDPSELAALDLESAREEIGDIVNDLIALKSIVMPIADQEDLLEDICNEILGLGALEPLLARDDVAGIMVNGGGRIYIEVHGEVREAAARFRDNSQLMDICRRIVAKVGRRIDDSSPICNARLPDGSHVNVIAPPLAIDGPALTIRKFKPDKLTLDQLVQLGAITEEGATILEIIARSRCNVLISGGIVSGKTTLLNCLTRCIEHNERIITCEHSAELQLPQPNVVRLETRPAGFAGELEITMRDLVRNCLRMRPERIIVGELRGAEALDLLRAMNTGHDGSMATLHADSPGEALSRLESMIAMGGLAMPAKTVREMIARAIDIIVQTVRLRDGSRRVTHVTEIVGIEGAAIATRDIFIFDIAGEDASGRIVGQHRSTAIGRPRFWERARSYNEEKRLAAALDASRRVGLTGSVN